jgi:hypothetical protein
MNPLQQKLVIKDHFSKNLAPHTFKVNVSPKTQIRKMIGGYVSDWRIC